MPSRKRIHTTIFDKPFNRSSKKLSHTRRIIAAEAARIMATQAQYNFRIAKQKAAERLGINSRTALPSNIEVENALRAYQQFYGGQQHNKQIHKMRQIALRVMRSLELFCPRLVGPVLEGTADKHTRVSLHVFNDPPDAIAMHLMEQGLSFRNEQKKIRWYDGSFRQVPLLVIDSDEVTIELALFSFVELRQAPPSPVDGRPQKRAPLSEVECLLAGA
jgi:hypothetical protein